MGVPLLLATCVVACLATTVLSYSVGGMDTPSTEVKRVFGDPCSTCLKTRDEFACRWCLNSARSQSTPFYNKREPGYSHVSTRRVSSFYSRRCGCCFQRRLAWCCNVCRNFARRGKRGMEPESRLPEGAFSVPQQLPHEIAAPDAGILNMAPSTADQITIADIISPDTFMNDDEMDPLNNQLPMGDLDIGSDVAMSALKELQKECFCCEVIGAASCCDVCDTAIDSAISGQ